MSVFFSAGAFMHSKYDDLERFLSDLFNGVNMIGDIRSKYLPERFPVKYGSVFEPKMLGMEESKTYLYDVDLRMRRTIDKLFSDFSNGFSPNCEIDACIVNRSPGRAFNFSRPFTNNCSPGFLSETDLREKIADLISKGTKKNFPVERVSLLDATCATGLVVAGKMEYLMKRNGWQRVVVVGLDFFNIGRSWILSGLGAAAINDSDDEPIAGPFSKERKGFHQSDGAAILIFETEEALKQRGQKAFSRVSSFYQNCDGESLVAGSTEGVQAENCMRAASRGKKISVVKTHGTATRLNDSNEAAAIKRAFGDPLVLSFKGQIGHTLNSSGLIELLICDGIFRWKKIPPALHLAPQDPSVSLRLPTTPQNFKEDHILVNAFGFGGYNASVLIERV